MLVRMAKTGTSDSEVDGDGEEGKGEGEDLQGDSQSLSEQQQHEPEGAMYVMVKPSKTVTSVSILIESLVKNLCMFYEADDEKVIKIYNLICEKLFEMQLLDESYKMVEFEGMRNQYQRAFHQLVTRARGGEQSVPIHLSWYNELSKEWSHYYKEFDEMEYIAGGGFGQVFRVKHKLDGAEYAVKKIYIRSEGIKSVMNYLSEVKTFASLNHSNIVQYKAAWLELGAPNSTTATIVDQEDMETFYSYPLQPSTDREQEVGLKVEITEKKSRETYIYPQMQSEISFEDATSEVSTDFEISFKNTSENKSTNFSDKKNIKMKRQKRSSTSEGGNAVCTIEEIQNLQLQSRHPSKWATLYIQMSLCQGTLKQWLERRNVVEESLQENENSLVPRKGHFTNRDQTILEILRQLLKGLEYIHSKNIVHHDIKPSNIFMENESGFLLVQLGDFGLACPLQSVKHSLAFGTKLYSAPEQLQGKCDPQSDMYSLGIVLFELVSSFKTEMERVENITRLRQGQSYNELVKNHPNFGPIIISLMAKNPKDRPNATSLLQRIAANESDSELVQELRSQLLAKDEEIMRLKEKLREYTS